MQVPRWIKPTCFVPVLGLIAALAASYPAQAQSGNQRLIREGIHEFIGVGGYWFSDSTANNALGSPKCGGTTTLYVKPAHRHNMLITGGIELFGASDHWLLGGGN